MRKYFILPAVILLLWLVAPAMETQPSRPPATSRSSCAAALFGQTPTTAQEPNREGGGAAPQTAAPPVDAGYVIGPQDVLTIEVWQAKEFSGPASVRPDGKITLPLVNDIQAAGLTPTELAASIKKLLLKYVTNPQVTVKVEQVNSKIVYLLGEVYKPGALPLLRNMTVLQALAMAGGPTQYANPKKIYVLRMESGKQVRYPFNYKQAVKGKNLQQNMTLQPGDTIVVP